MSDRIVRLFVVGALVAAAAACSKSNPAQPSSGAAGATASVVAPRPVTPANAALVPNVSQPLTLVVQNGVSTQPGATYTFEIATDPAFTTKVQTKDAVPEGGGGQTSDADPGQRGQDAGRAPVHRVEARVLRQCRELLRGG